MTNAVTVTNDWRQVVVQPSGQSGFYRLAQLTWPIPFSDSDTVALWLFDETQYPFTPLTDASQYLYDLELYPQGQLVAGRYGNALSVTPGTTNSVIYAAFSGSAPHDNMRNGSTPVLWGPTVAPEQILNAFTQNWTCEFWLKLNAAPGSEVAILSLGNAFDPGVEVHLTAGATSFLITNSYGGFVAECPTASGSLTDLQWHHVAFTRAAADGQVKHYLDGQVQSAVTVSSIATQPLPAVVWPATLDHDSFGWTSGTTIATRRAGRFNVELGSHRNGSMDLNGLIDEMRISKVIRYTNDFTPGTLSRNYAPGAPGPSVVEGLPLLFAGNPSPLQLGGRKHLFLDTNLFAGTTNVTVGMNPATTPEALNIYMSGHCSVYDITGRVYMLEEDGYSSSQGNVWVRYSDDGLNFVEPDWGLYGDSRVAHRQPMHGSVFEDVNSRVAGTNSNAASNERYKLASWLSNRGMYVYLSADGIFWRRNETLMLPLMSGGEADILWDDQRGYYAGFLKRDSSFTKTGCVNNTRQGVGFKTTNVLKPWPFTVQSPPYYEGWPFPCVTCEGPVVFVGTGTFPMYRSRAQKYIWAPDTYLAFVWRDGNNNTKVDLGVSRDGDNWTYFATSITTGPFYQPGLGRGHMGMIRRGDEIWQYYDDGATTYRCKQRLDGFTSLNAGGTTGGAVSKPLVFSGNKLVLNLNATGGSARVGILDAAGNPIPGYTVGDCDAITANATTNIVTWQGNSAVGNLAGTTLKLQFEMTNTKLYAIQFVP